jgi:hypothetical protein
MANETLRTLINTHIERYPQLDILDIYRLLHQAEFGPGHALKNLKSVREWLERESEIIEADTSASMLESVHPEGSIVRLHLRPYLAAKADLGKLLQAYIESSKAVEGRTDRMKAAWEYFQSLVQVGGVLESRFDRRTVALIGRTRAAENWPASHHSPAFEQAYKPAYRVLTRSLAERLLDGQKITYTVLP